MMQKQFSIQYLTDENGTKKAVQIPYNEWDILLKELKRLSQLHSLKMELKQGFTDLMAVEQGQSKEISLSEFEDE